MTTIACVMRSGGDFGPEYVLALLNGVRRHTNADFTVLTDCPETAEIVSGCDGAHAVPLAYDTPGWWSKLELFRDDVFPAGEAVVYFDLDTVITGPVPALMAYNGVFAATRGPRFGNLGSGVMAWRHGDVLETVLPVYLDDPHGCRQFYDRRRHAASGGRRGDQGLIADRLETEGIGWQAVEDIQPGIRRYARMESKTLDDTRVVVFSGRHSRPHNVWPEIWKPETEGVWTP